MLVVTTLSLARLASLASLTSRFLTTILLTAIHVEHFFQLVNRTDEIRCFLLRNAVSWLIPFTNICDEFRIVIFVSQLYFFVVRKP